MGESWCLSGNVSCASWKPLPTEQQLGGVSGNHAILPYRACRVAPQRSGCTHRTHSLRDAASPEGAHADSHVSGTGPGAPVGPEVQSAQQAAKRVDRTGGKVQSESSSHLFCFLLLCD